MGKKARNVVALIKPMENSGFETSTSNSHVVHGWEKVVYRKRNPKQKPTDLEASDGVSPKNVPNGNLTNGNNAFHALKFASKEKPIVTLPKAAAKIRLSLLTAFFAKPSLPDLEQLMLYTYLEKAFSQVWFPWVEMFKETPLSKLINVPLSDIPEPVYKISVDWIKQREFVALRQFVSWAFERILDEQDSCGVAPFVVLAMVLRSKPDVLIFLLPMLRERAIYQGQDKLPVLVWMMAQASQGDLCGGLHSWAHNLLPLVGNNKSKCCSPQSVDLILQLVENILSNPEAESILVNGAVREGERLIPPTSFEILVRLTFPASSARVKATERFEVIYPLLKEVALAQGSNAMKEIFTFSLKLAGEGNPVLAEEATEIAIRSLTENADCFKQWDILYKENVEASIALLKKLVENLKDHSLKLLSTPSDTLTLSRAIKSFGLKNEKAITEGGANCYLYKEADKSCKVISRRLSPGSGCLKGITTAITAVVLVAAGAAAGATTALVLSSQ